MSRGSRGLVVPAATLIGFSRKQWRPHRRLGQCPAITPERAVPVGAFADPSFPTPSISVWEERRHSWLRLPDDIEHVN